MFLGLIKNEVNMVDITDREMMTFSYVPRDPDKEIAVFRQFLATVFPDVEIIKTNASAGRLFIQVSVKK